MSNLLPLRRGLRWRALAFALCLGAGGLLVGSLGCSSSSPKQEAATAPALASQPASLTVNVGQAATFSVTATGTAPLTYQWNKGGAAITGATAASFALPAVAAGDAGSYTVTVTNSVGSVTSSAAVLTVNQPVSITTQPLGQTIVQGQPVTFTVVAAGTAPITYQWNKAGVAITGATTASFTIPAVAAGDAGSYTVTVTNTAGSVTSSAAVLAVTQPVTFITQPAGQTLVQGQPATFTVVAAGTAPFTYQWNKGGTAITGATQASYAIAAVALADAGSYTATVTNLLGSVSSNAAVLVVTPLPTAISVPANQTVLDGATATFSVTATGSGTLTYQWLRAGVAVTGATSSSYTTPPVVHATDNGVVFTCAVTNDQSQSLTSQGATLTVTPIAPAITTAPAAQTVTEGAPASFTVAATGTAPLSYQWSRNGVVIAGATSDTLTLANPTVAADNTAAITVTVTNGAGQTTTSASVVLTVQPAAALPVITAQPQTAIVRPPDGATFSVTATGTDLTYAWKKNGSAITGATSATYTVASTDLHNVGDVYAVAVTNASGSVDSQGAALTVQAPKPVFAGDPTAAGNSNYTVWSSWSTALPADNLGSFRFGYDTAKLNPLWSAACFFPSAPWTFARPSSYPDDTRIPGSLTTSDYTGTGWSRGHQVGFADLRDVYGPEAGASTMYMSNMCPQDQTFNGGAWQTFEALCTTTLPATFGRVWVYTGPIFGVQIVSPISTKNIPVPNAYYKIMVRETILGTPKVIAAILPNSSTIGRPGATIASTDFWKFVTTVDRVQELTGLTFFPVPATPLPANFTSTVDVTGWGAPLQQGPNRPNVHMISPSWDTEYKHVHNSTNAVTIIDLDTAVVGASIPFKALATADPDAIVSTAWNFGDGSATDTRLDTSHAYATSGNFTVTFTATDAASHSSSISRVITIAAGGNVAPVFVPNVLPAVSVAFNATGTQTFKVTDDTTAAGTIGVTATSSNHTLLPDASISVAYNPATESLQLSLVPVTGQSGTSTITVVATDQDGAPTTRTFSFVVAPEVVAGTSVLMISQYYEGSSNNKWIEITNVGAGTYDAAVLPMYLGQWNNPRTPGAYTVLAIPGTIAPGASVLFRNSSSVLPASTYNGGSTVAPNGTPIISSTSYAMSFNGNDIMFLTPTATSDIAAYNNRTDVIGNYISATDVTAYNWDPLPANIPISSWGPAGIPPGQDRSFVRNAAVTAPNPAYDPSEWTQVDAVQIKTGFLGFCETVPATDTRYLGFHVFGTGPL